jgi:hypothetical protein
LRGLRGDFTTLAVLPKTVTSSSALGENLGEGSGEPEEDTTKEGSEELKGIGETRDV